MATVSGKPFYWTEPELQNSVYKPWAYWINFVELNVEVWGSNHMVVDVGLWKHGLAIMLMALVEAKVRRMFEERKLADSKVVFERTADESANGRRFKLVFAVHLFGT